MDKDLKSKFLATVEQCMFRGSDYSFFSAVRQKTLKSGGGGTRVSVDMSAHDTTDGWNRSGGVYAVDVQ